MDLIGPAHRRVGVVVEREVRRVALGEGCEDCEKGGEA